MHSKFNRYSIALQDALSKLYRYIEQFHTVSTEMEIFFNRNASLKKFANRKYIASPLDLEKAYFFIVSGNGHIMVKENRTETSLRLLNENMFVMHHPVAAIAHFIQAIGPIEILSFPAKAIDQFCDFYPAGNYIFRQLEELELNRCKRSAVINLINPFKRRLCFFRETHPGYEDRIPLKYIASYLRMNIETLSRLRTVLIHDQQHAEAEVSVSAYQNHQL